MSRYLILTLHYMKLSSLMFLTTFFQISFVCRYENLVVFLLFLVANGTLVGILYAVCFFEIISMRT